MAIRKLRQAPGREAVVGLQQPFELEIGLIVEGHRGEVAQLQPRLRHDIGQGVGRKVRVVLLAGEALFLGRGDDLAVHQDGRGAVVIEGGKPENGVRQGARGPNSMRPWNHPTTRPWASSAATSLMSSS